jgi:hypothetical protein
MESNEDVVIIWEPAPLVKPEFRLYYDDKGKVICYTCEKLEGDYIVIDTQTYAEMRHDIRVVDGKIVPENSACFISRYYKSDKGTLCMYDDISIVSDDEGQYWELKTYEFS